MDSQRLLRVVLIVGVLVKQDIFNLCRDVKIREYNCNCFNRRRDGVSSRRRGIHSEVPKEELGLMILSPRVSLPQRMEEGCFFRLFIMT